MNKKTSIFLFALLMFFESISHATIIGDSVGLFNYSIEPLINNNWNNHTSEWLKEIVSSDSIEFSNSIGSSYRTVDVREDTIVFNYKTGGVSDYGYGYKLNSLDYGGDIKNVTIKTNTFGLINPVAIDFTRNSITWEFEDYISLKSGEYTLELSVETEKADYSLIENPQTVYGVFIGTNDTAYLGAVGLDGGDNARAVRDAFGGLSNVINDDEHLFFLEYEDIDTISFMELDAAITSRLDLVDENDLFILYISGHGATYNTDGGETASNPPAWPGHVPSPTGDEGIQIGSGSFADDDLTDILNDDKYAALNKWIFLDSCQSGGFWGDGTEVWGNDLSQTPNVSFLASADEDSGSLYGTFTGRSLFSRAIVEGLTGSETDDSVSFDELAQFVKEWIPEMDEEATDVFYRYSGPDIPLPDIIVNPEVVRLEDFVWSPFSASNNPDTQNAILTGAAPVPEPSTILLLGLGLGFSFVNFRRKTKRLKSNHD